MREPWLEYIPSNEIDDGITCGDIYGPEECEEVATVWMVFWEGYEWLAFEYCRPHGNLALIAERH